MSVKHTNAFILNTIKYGDKRVICRAITASNGALSFIASVGKKSQRLNCFQAFTPVEIAFTKQAKSTLFRASKVNLRSAFVFNSSSISVNSLRFFIAELLYHVVKEEEQNDALFNLLEQTALKLKEEKELNSLAIDFLFAIFSILGIEPDFSHSSSYFDLQEAHFVSSPPDHPSYLGKVETLNFINWYRGIKTGGKEKRILLNGLLQYLDHQLELKVSKLKSKSILEELFDQ